MKRTAGLAVALVMALLIAVSANAAVTNINLSSVGTQGVTGTATAITNRVNGTTPFTNVELNAKLSSAPSANMVYTAWLYNSKTNTANSLGVFNGTMFSMKTMMSSFGTGTPWDSIAISMDPVNSTSTTPTTIVAQGMLPGTTVASADFPSMAVLPADESFQRQAIMSRFNMTSTQFDSLRMRGYSYSDIAAISNAASKCNKSTDDVASALEAGQSWDMIASSCNLTVAQLLEPVPTTVVAGYQGTIPAPGTYGATGMGVQVPTVYLKYPNGRPVITRDEWMQYSRAGFSWRDVAVAANISSRTGDSIDDLLRANRIQGMTWRTIAIQRGLDVNQMLDVSMWPYEQGPAMRNWQYGTPGTTGTYSPGMSPSMAPSTTTTPESTTTPSMTPSESTTPSTGPSMTPSENTNPTPSSSGTTY